MTHEEMEDRWLDRHSVNCIECGKLVDERECVPGPGCEGDICPQCVETKRPRPLRFGGLVTSDVFLEMLRTRNFTPDRGGQP